MAVLFLTREDVDGLVPEDGQVTYDHLKPHIQVQVKAVGEAQYHDLNPGEWPTQESLKVTIVSPIART